MKFLKSVSLFIIFSCGIVSPSLGAPTSSPCDQWLSVYEQNIKPQLSLKDKLLLKSMQNRFQQLLSLECHDLGENCSEKEVLLAVHKTIDEAGQKIGKIRFYAFISAIMMTSSVATSQLMNFVPDYFSFFFAQLTTLGVVVIGAPIWKPISSKAELWIFKRLKNDPILHQSISGQEDYHLKLWHNLQGRHSLNSQMIKNSIFQYLNKSLQNFSLARTALLQNDLKYAAKQIAVAAIDTYQYFDYIPTTDPTLNRNVRSILDLHSTSLTDNDIQILKQLILKQIHQEISIFGNDSAEEYFKDLVQQWMDF